MKWETDKAEAKFFTNWVCLCSGPVEREYNEWSRLLRSSSEMGGSVSPEYRSQLWPWTNKRLTSSFWASTPSSKLQWGFLIVKDSENWTSYNLAESEKRKVRKEVSRKEKNGLESLLGPSLSSQALVVVSQGKTSISSFKEIDVFGRVDK